MQEFPIIDLNGKICMNVGNNRWIYGLYAYELVAQ